MKKHSLARLLALMGLLYCALALWSAADGQMAVDAWAAPGNSLSAKRVRVLFIGNSYTYFNNSPGMLATLQQIWTEGEAMAAIRNGSWELQRQTSPAGR